MNLVGRPRVSVRCLPVHFPPRLEVNKIRRVVMIVGVSEVSDINYNGMIGRSLFVEGDGDGSYGVG